jgi:hypothetical protein
LSSANTTVDSTTKPHLPEEKDVQVKEKPKAVSVYPATVTATTIVQVAHQ